MSHSAGQNEAPSFRSIAMATSRAHSQRWLYLACRRSTTQTAELNQRMPVVGIRPSAAADALRFP